MTRSEAFQLDAFRHALAVADGTRVPCVLVAVDMSATTVEVLKHVSSFAKRFQAVVRLLCVVQLNIVGEERGIPRSGLIRQLTGEARQNLQELVAMLWGGEIMASIVIREGRPDQVIVQEARNTNASLIIMGAQHRTWLSRLLAPDTLAQVINDAPCPVLTVRVVDQPSVAATHPFSAFNWQKRNLGKRRGLFKH